MDDASTLSLDAGLPQAVAPFRSLFVINVYRRPMNNRFSRLLLVPALLLTILSGCSSESSPSATAVQYFVDFPDIVQHRARITARFEGVPAGQTLELRLARTSPGRYALHEFARHVVELQARNGTGASLDVTKPNPYQWNVTGHDGTVEVTYSLYGDRADGTFNGFDRTFAHMNGPATWLWARDQGDAPVTVSFEKPEPDWDIATQLFPTDDPDRFTAPNLYYLLDSPVRIGDLDWYTIERDSQEVRIALQHAGTQAQAEAWAANVWKIVDAQTDVFGELPSYDNGTYTFLTTYLPHVAGDGMEHRNSTVVTSTTPLNDDGTGNLGTMAHEYFHQWNVERIRPANLEPFDFEEANLSDLLWLAEGFTSYYTGLSIRRAGITMDEEYGTSLSGTVNAVINAPGRKHRSAAEMSQWATFSDRGVFGDRMDTGNTFLSYYTWGSGIGLALDLTLRTEFDASLDAFMRLMWERFGKEEISYTLDDARQTLGDLTEDPAFADSFFERYVTGREAPDYADLLGRAGLLVRPARDGQVHRAISVTDADGGVRISGAPPEGSSWYEAGWDQGDLIQRINGRPVRSRAALMRMLDAADPGDEWSVEGTSRGMDVETSVVLEEDPRLEVVLMEDAGMTPDAQQLDLRSEWMGG